MRKLFSFVASVLIASVSLSAQEFSAPSKTVSYADTTTTYTYRIKADTFKVYKSKSGAFYIWKVSKKTGKKYKYYLPKEIQIKMGRKYAA